MSELLKQLKRNEAKLFAGQIGCIFCGDKTFNQEFTDFQISGYRISATVQCRECHSVWESFFELTSIYYNEGRI